jgi:hypothetical protein
LRFDSEPGRVYDLPARLILAPQPERAAAPRSSHLVRGAFFGAAPSGRATSRLRARTKSLRFTSWRSPSASCGLTRKRMLLLRAAGRSISLRRTQACPSPNKTERPFCTSLCQRRSPYWGMGNIPRRWSGTLSPFGPSWRSGAASASRSAAPSRAPDAPLTRAPNVPLGVHEVDLESEPRWTM